MRARAELGRRLRAPQRQRDRIAVTFSEGTDALVTVIAGSSSER